MKPDLFDWSSLDFESTSCVDVLILKKNQICKPEKSRNLILIQEHSQFKDAKLNCEAIQGYLFIPKNESQLNFLGQLLESSVQCECAPGKKCAYIGGEKKNDSKVNEISEKIV